MTTLTFPVPRPAASQPVQKSSVRISEQEFSRLGITTEAQRAVYKAIKAQPLKHEASVAKAAGLDELTTVRALHGLEHLHLIRRGSAPFGGLAAFEVIEKR